MSENRTYQVVTVPRLNGTDPKLQELAGKFRELRLKSLQVAADAFASSYESEIQRGLDQTVQRLLNPKAVHFLALSKNGSRVKSLDDGDDVDRILRSDWVGMIVLLGPEEGSELSVPSANLDPFPRMTAKSTAEYRLFDDPGAPGGLHFHINATYVDPSTRGGGLGKALMDAALRRVGAESMKANASLRVSLSVFSHNVAARKLYERSGFKVVKDEVSRSRPEYRAIHMELSLAAEP